MRRFRQHEIVQGERGIGERRRTDLFEVRIFAVHPEHRHAGDAGALLELGGERDGRRGFVERVKRAAQRARLLPRDRAHRLAAGEALERGQRSGRCAQAAVHLGELARQLARERRALRFGQACERRGVAPVRRDALARKRSPPREVVHQGIGEALRRLGRTRGDAGADRRRARQGRHARGRRAAPTPQVRCEAFRGITLGILGLGPRRVNGGTAEPIRCASRGPDRWPFAGPREPAPRRGAAGGAHS